MACPFMSSGHLMACPFLSCGHLMACPFLSCDHLMACPFLSCDHLMACPFLSCGHLMACPFLSCDHLMACPFLSCGHLMACPFLSSGHLMACPFLSCDHLMACPFLSCGHLMACPFLSCGHLMACLFLSCGHLMACPFLSCGHLMACPFLSCGHLMACLFLSCGHLMACPFLSCGHLMACPFLSCGHLMACPFLSCGHLMACPFLSCGNQIEVGDKILELLDDLMTKLQRGHLPPTPGVPIHPTPLPKRTENFRQIKAGHCQCEYITSHLSSIYFIWESLPEGKDPLKEWCLSHFPVNDLELLETAKKPDQEVSQHRRDIVRCFLCDIMKESNVERKGKHTGYHWRVTAFLVEILEQFLDPSYLVLLCLQLLRALSHVPGNVTTLIANNTVAAVLGSMAVYKDNETVQNNSLDILAKLATYVPAVLEKLQLYNSLPDCFQARRLPLSLFVSCGLCPLDAYDLLKEDPVAFEYFYM
ncbi:hypothetical protein Btru_061975 [Bulinus truncatus]|nr:hypothetical protein Btru_061975 [Bulinus truncatus]